MSEGMTGAMCVRGPRLYPLAVSGGAPTASRSAASVGRFACVHLTYTKSRGGPKIDKVSRDFLGTHQQGDWGARGIPVGPSIPRRSPTSGRPIEAMQHRIPLHARGGGLPVASSIVAHVHLSPDLRAGGASASPPKVARISETYV